MSSDGSTRRSGVLLHPTSLPGPPGNGDLGPDAYRLVDFLQECGITVWQTLPLAPPHADGSPYQCLSVHAGNPLLISGEVLVQKGWLDPAALPPPPGTAPEAHRAAVLAKAFEGFSRSASEQDRADLQAFVREHEHWLQDYALYLGLRQGHRQRPWSEWPEPLRRREPEALAEARSQLKSAIDQVCFEQFLFFRQWQDLRSYAAQRDVAVFGDMPIFVAHDSADVWAHQEYFELDDAGQPTVVAGVPPDYFSATGQRWGNPLYCWSRMEASGFRWWIERMGTQLKLFDMVRIDHFRGFQAYWSIPASEETAVNGHWVEAPGDALFKKFLEHFGCLPLVAEDLGVITPEVEDLRDRYNLPGMKILQFAFEGGADNPYLPHQHIPRCVVYTGTHDNDTTRGWFEALPAEDQEHIQDYLGYPQEPMPWPLIRTALASVSELAIVPIQDFLMLASEGRMNRPSTQQGNWRWRFDWAQVESGLPGRLRHLMQLYGRVSS